ncbi:hypothetical protein MMC22_007376 [Lobaria immixta]|nr:hypothetical protein [Lobaria immixta]
MYSLNGSSVPRHCAVVEAGSPSNQCPSSEWDFMQKWLSSGRNSIPIGFQKQSAILSAVDTIIDAIQLTGKTAARQYKSIQFGYGNPLPGKVESIFEAVAVVSTTQQAVIADALTSTSTIWNVASDFGQIGSHHGASLFDRQKAIHAIDNNYYQPYSSAFCVRDSIQGPNDQRILAFPISGSIDYTSTGLLSNINTSISGIPAVEATSIRRAQLLALPGMESDNRVKWVQLPQSLLTGVSVGLVVLLPKSSSDLSKQTTTAIQNNTDIVVCNIAAGWGASSLNITVAKGGHSATSSLTKYDAFSLLSNFSTPYSNRFQSLTDQSVFFAQPMFPSIPIAIDVEWAEYLNPYVPSVNTTVIDFLLKDVALNGSKVALPEIATMQIVSGLMTNGLARTSFTSELQGKVKLKIDQKDKKVKLAGFPSVDLGKVPDFNLWASGKSDVFTVDPEESKEWVKLRVDSTIQGYAYNIEGPAPKIAIAFLLTYCCFALSHCFYSGISGISPLPVPPLQSRHKC